MYGAYPERRWVHKETEEDKSIQSVDNQADGPVYRSGERSFLCGVCVVDEDGTVTKDVHGVIWEFKL
jgi:hypothetical protein